MPRETPSPIDLPEPEAPVRPALGWTTGAIALASLLLLAMNAVSLRDWIEDQSPSPLQAQAAAIAESFTQWTDEIGLGAPRALLHDVWKRAEAARFTKETREQGEGADAPDQR